MVLSPYDVQGDQTSGSDDSSDGTSIIDWDDLPVLSDIEDTEENTHLPKNEGFNEASTPIPDQDEQPVKSDDDSINKDSAEGTELPKDNCMEDQDNDYEAKLQEHEEATTSFGDGSDNAKFDWDEWAKFVTENLNELVQGYTNLIKHTMALNGMIRSFKDRVDCDHSIFKKDIQALQEGQTSIKAEIEDGKANLHNYAKENESLKDKIDEQEFKITALMDNNMTFKLQIGSLLYTIRSLEDKLDRLNHDSPNVDKSTEWTIS